MLKDRHEIQIMSRARQRNVADPKRSREHFDRIFADFFHDVSFQDARLLDLGPGQYDFAELADARGATTEGMDKDEAVIELGAYRGLPIRRGDLKRLRASDFAVPFDGLFCKFSINAFWFHDDEAHRAYVHELDLLLRPDGWGWIAPWNGVPKDGLDPGRVRDVLAVQADAFRGAGFVGIDLTEDLAKRYGVHGSTANRALFLRGIAVPSRLADCPRL